MSETRTPEGKRPDVCIYCHGAGTDHLHEPGRAHGACCAIHGMILLDSGTGAHRWVIECYQGKNAALARSEAALQAANAQVQDLIAQDAHHIQMMDEAVIERNKLRNELLCMKRITMQYRSLHAGCSVCKCGCRVDRRCSICKAYDSL